MTNYDGKCLLYCCLSTGAIASSSFPLFLFSAPPPLPPPHCSRYPLYWMNFWRRHGLGNSVGKAFCAKHVFYSCCLLTGSQYRKFGSHDDDSDIIKITDMRKVQVLRRADWPDMASIVEYNFMTTALGSGTPFIGRCTRSLPRCVCLFCGCM